MIIFFIGNNFYSYFFLKYKLEMEQLQFKNSNKKSEEGIEKMK